MLVMAPVPVFLLLILVTLFEVLMMTMRVMFPLLVINHLAAPGMAIVVIRIIVSGMNCAAGGECGSKGYQGERD